jgi:hypothetical protein
MRRRARQASAQFTLFAGSSPAGGAANGEGLFLLGLHSGMVNRRDVRDWSIVITLGVPFAKSRMRTP